MENIDRIINYSEDLWLSYDKGYSDGTGLGAGHSEISSSFFNQKHGSGSGWSYQGKGYDDFTGVGDGDGD